MGNERAVDGVSLADARAAVLERTRADIAEHGWSVIGVFPTPGEPSVSFAYTVGLSAKGLPELAIYGLPVDVGHQVLNVVARQMVDAGVALVTGQRIEGVLASEVPLVAVSMSNTRDLNMVREVYGSVASAVQVCWPDVDGLMPWEQGGRAGEDEQPVHGEGPEGRPVFRAKRVAVETPGELADLVAEHERGSLSCVDPQADNDRRAAWGARALIGYATFLGQGKCELVSTASDMLADVRHLFDALGLDWEDAMSRVERNYRAEILGEL